MFNLDNIYYFPKNIDVRVCPKNALDSTKQFYLNIMVAMFPDMSIEIKDELMWSHENKMIIPENSVIGSSYRWRRVLKYSDSIDFPFRKNSIKFAIKRDPVERFKSAVEMLQTGDMFFDFREVSIVPPDREYLFYDSIDALLFDLEDGKILEKHLLPQTYFLGNKSKYDFVYDIKEYRSFMKDIFSIYNAVWDEKMWYIHKNISNNTPLEIVEELKKTSDNVTTMQNYGKKQALITKSMTEEHVNRIKKIYQIDYDNGWC